MPCQRSPLPTPLTREQLVILERRLRQACVQLASLGAPDALVHLDLNPGNIVLQANGCIFLDWAEACVGCPFLAFEYLREYFGKFHSGDVDGETGLFMHYYRHWQFSESVTSEAQRVTPLIAVFAYAVSAVPWRDPQTLQNADSTGCFGGLPEECGGKQICSQIEAMMCHLVSARGSDVPVMRRLECFGFIFGPTGCSYTFDLYLIKDDFFSLYDRVRKFPVNVDSSAPRSLERVNRAIELTCAWYPRQVLCLHRSAVTTCLLRRLGVAAQLVIGAQLSPFKAHAWVEVDGAVVNDRTYLLEIYTPLERC